jgi:tRNA (guanine-N7-)-methyltransferase
VLEIGFGDGEALFTSAVNRPDVDFLGIEVHEPGVGHLLVLLEQADLSNVRIIRRDAVDVIDEMLGFDRFDVVNIFFPDPWPKKRHHKRRLIQPPFVARLRSIIKTGGLLHIATDWPDYATHIRSALASSTAFEPLDPTSASARPLAARPPTKFERRGRRLGHAVVDLYYAHVAY